MKVVQNVDVVVKLSPWDIARLFSQLDAEEQAEFFDALAMFVHTWKGQPEGQWHSMNNYIGKDGAQLVRSMAEFMEE